ncbi:MAG: hypothetical protein EOO38_18885 [Cytophagaceae bacterium]|nr:MAG: hypothetical protein EOO38_18885 [Cytophagaceae bacterium]
MRSPALPNVVSAQAAKWSATASPASPPSSQPGDVISRKTRSGPVAARTRAFKMVITALGKIKVAITGTYRFLYQKHVRRYLAEVRYRSNQ